MKASSPIPVRRASRAASLTPLGDRREASQVVDDLPDETLHEAAVRLRHRCGAWGCGHGRGLRRALVLPLRRWHAFAPHPDRPSAGAFPSVKTNAFGTVRDGNSSGIDS
jgi:hypothetical protein